MGVVLEGSLDVVGRGSESASDLERGSSDVFRRGPVGVVLRGSSSMVGRGSEDALGRGLVDDVDPVDWLGGGGGSTRGNRKETHGVELLYTVADTACTLNTTLYTNSSMYIYTHACAHTHTHTLYAHIDKI